MDAGGVQGALPLTPGLPATDRSREHGSHGLVYTLVTTPSQWIVTILANQMGHREKPEVINLGNSWVVTGRGKWDIHMKLSKKKINQ